jgi:hypothetical protein
MLSMCPPCLLKAELVEPEGIYIRIPYEHTCDMTPVSQNMLQLAANHSPEQIVIRFCCGLDCRENIASNVSSVNLLSLCVCVGDSLVLKQPCCKHCHTSKYLTVEELLYVPFPVQSVSYKRKVGD